MNEEIYESPVTIVETIGELSALCGSGSGEPYESGDPITEN